MTHIKKFVRKHFRWFVSATAVAMSLAVVLGAATSVFGASLPWYDLTTDNATLTATINGAIWERFPVDFPTGTGNFHTFHQVGANGSEQGYNTDYTPKQFDEGSSPNFNRSFLLKDVPQVMIGGVIYREFQLDINEQGSVPNWYMSLDKFQVWVTSNPNIHNYDNTTYTFPAGATLVYDLDGDENTYIKMDFRTNPGSGKRDYRVLVPQTMFDGKTGIYVVLFVRHGDAYSTDDGFEEWGVRILNATKAGYKFNDLNADGIWDPNGIDNILGNADDEVGLNDWTINLVGTSEGSKKANDISMTTTTTNDGSGNPGYYSFSVVSGNYTVSEVLQAGWTQSYPASGNYTVTLGNGALDLDNHFGNYQRGNLQVTKTVVLGSVVNPTGISENFTVTVTGPSYPSGTSHVFHLVNGVLTPGDSPWTLNNLIPGTYTVNETNPGPEWAVTGGGNVTVSGGQTASVTVTNTFVPGELRVTKNVDFAGLVGSTGISENFTVTVTGPSYPSGTTHVFHLVNGVLTPGDSPWILSNLIPGSYTITEADAGDEWNEVVTGSPATVPAGNFTSATVTNTFVPGNLSITKVVSLGSYLFPNTVSENFTVTVTGPSYPGGTTHVFHLVNGSLTPGDSPWVLSNLIPGVYTVTETNPGPEWSVTNMTGNVTVNPNETAPRTITNTLIVNPNTRVTITPSVWETFPGGNVTLYISENNTGNVALTNPYVVLSYNSTNITLNKASANFTSGDTGNDGILGVGETWTWSRLVTISVTTNFTVTGFGTDPFGNPVTYPLYPNERASVEVKTVGATRTQGFWATHLDFTTYIFTHFTPPDADNSTGYINLGYPLAGGNTANVTSMSKLMGIFWANNAKNSDGEKRSQLGQARETTANQALAAILNSAMPGGKPLPNFSYGPYSFSPLTIANIATVLSSTNIDAIKALGAALDAFNNSGETIALDPSLPPTGRADPQGAKAIANIPWANSP